MSPPLAVDGAEIAPNEAKPENATVRCNSLYFKTLGFTEFVGWA